MKDAGQDVPGGYADLEVLGSGARGIYRARQERFDRTVALQILRIDHVDAALRRRFRDLCRTLGHVSAHPHVATFYDAGFTPAGRPFAAVEYCPKGSLHDRLASSGPLTAAETVAFGAKLAGALDAIHSAGRVHGDIGPGNVLLTQYGEPVLAGAGLAPFTQALEAGGLGDASRLVHVAPELLQGAATTVTSDIYSLGSTLYTVLAGRPPYAPEAEAGLAPLVQRALRDDLPPLRDPDGADELMAVLRTTMAADPDRRYASAQAIGDALLAINPALPEVATPESPPPVAAAAEPMADPAEPPVPDPPVAEAADPALPGRAPGRWPVRRAALLVGATTFAGFVMALGAALGARSVAQSVMPPGPAGAQPAPTSPRPVSTAKTQQAPDLPKLDQQRYQPRNLRASPAPQHVALAWELPPDAERDGAAVIVRQEPTTRPGVIALTRTGGALPRTYQSTGLQPGKEYCYLVEVLLQRPDGTPALARSGPVCAVPR